MQRLTNKLQVNYLWRKLNHLFIIDTRFRLLSQKQKVLFMNRLYKHLHKKFQIAFMRLSVWKFKHKMTN